MSSKKGSKEKRSPSPRLQRPSSAPGGAGGYIAASALADSVSVAQFKFGAAARKKVGESQGGLSASHSLEEYCLTNLVEDDPEKLLVVSHTETIASVLEQLHRVKTTSCVVNLASGEREFFDCMDFGCYLLEVITGGASTPADLRAAAGDWQAVKRKLRRVAQEPVRKALRGGLARSTKGASDAAAASFARFDSDQKLESLIPLLKSQRPVPLFRHGELSQTLTGSDVLEICLSMSEESRQLLESLPLEQVIARSPGALSKVGVSEDQSLLEVIHLMREANVHVVPVLACSNAEESSPANFGRGVQLTSSLQDAAAGVERPALVGQFDISSLRSLYVKAVVDGEEAHAVSQWWWEDDSVTTNLFLETCVGFLSLGPALATEETVPFAAVLSSEPVLKAISRCIMSPHHSVVVYQVDPHAAAGAAGARSKPLEGLASSLSLLIGMLDAGILQQLVFDTSKPASVRKHGHMLRKPTLTVNSVKVALEQSEQPDTQRKSRIVFHSAIEVERMVVPVCPNHTVHFLRFTKEEEANRVMDFAALRDAPLEGKATGATASCLACQRSLGKISTSTAPARVPPPLAGSLPRSALKAGTPGAGKSAELAAALASKKPSSEQLRTEAPASPASDGWSAGWPFSGFCCSSQCFSGSKDTVVAAAAEKGMRHPPRSASDPTGRNSRLAAVGAAGNDAFAREGGETTSPRTGRRRSKGHSGQSNSKSGPSPKAS